MNKDEALRRLDAIEKEQAELRKIIEKGDTLVFRRDKIYVALYDGKPWMMLGEANAGFCFYQLIDTESSYAMSKKSGQECLLYHTNAGFDIHVFDATTDALAFFLNHL